MEQRADSGEFPWMRCIRIRFQSIKLRSISPQKFCQILLIKFANICNVKLQISFTSLATNPQRLIPNLAMGNQHSSPDKDKEKEKEKDKNKEKDKLEQVRSTPIHEKTRSRTVTASPLPPTETKVNAEQTSASTATDSKYNLETQAKVQASSTHDPASGQSTPSKDPTTGKQVPGKDVAEAVKKMHLKDLPKLNEEDIRKEAAQTEPTPKFETMRVPSQSSIVDEDELKEADKSGNRLIMNAKLMRGLAQVPLILDWNEGGHKVAVAGTFTGWRKRVNLRKTYTSSFVLSKNRNGGFSTILQVRPGTHRFHFLVDGEWRISNQFATAVDSEGNLLNYLEASYYSENDADIEYSHSASISCMPYV